MSDYKKTLCVDFDGVIHSYSSGWKGADTVSDPPVTGAIEWLFAMVKSGFLVAIYSSRSGQEGGIDAMKNWLQRYGANAWLLQHLEFPTEKPAAFLTIDDRCFRFEGDFPSADWINRFVPWNKWGNGGGI